LEFGQLEQGRSVRPRNPRAEARRPKEARNPKLEDGEVRRADAMPGWRWIRASGFGLLSAFGLLISVLSRSRPALEHFWRGQGRLSFLLSSSRDGPIMPAGRNGCGRRLSDSSNEIQNLCH
jgi:hypothetical protein